MEYSKIGFFLAKVETTYGTDATPDATNNIAIARGLIPVEPDGTPIYREILDGGYAKVAGLTSMRTVTFKVRVELRGNRTDGTATDISSGSIGNVLDYDPLLRACDLAATYVAETAGSARDGLVYYQPAIPADEGVSLTIKAYSAKKLYIGVGCKGTIDNITFAAGQIAVMDITFTGRLLANPADASPPAPTNWLSTVPPIWAVAAPFTAQSASANATTNAFTQASHNLYQRERIKFGGTVPPAPLAATALYYVVRTDANTFKVRSTIDGTDIDLTDTGTAPTFSIPGAFALDTWFSPVVSSCSFKPGQILAPREDANVSGGIKGHIITGRETSGEFMVESETEAAAALWADWSAGTVKSLRVNCGVNANSGADRGNRVCVDAKIRYGTPKYQEASGKRMMQVPFTCALATPGDATGSEFRLIVQ